MVLQCHPTAEHFMTYVKTKYIQVPIAYSFLDSLIIPPTQEDMKFLEHQFSEINWIKNCQFRY